MADRAPVAGAARPRPRPGTGAVRTAADRALAVRDQAVSGQLANTAGSAVVTAAWMGRLFGRVGWRIARQLPGMAAVEQQGHRLREAAAAELIRLLELPQQILGGAEDQRVMMLVRNAATDPAPLRTAMGELLHRSDAADRTSSREYLFGTIVSQLVPDEARLLSALADRPAYAAVDVVAKPGRGASRDVLSNASTVGVAAKIGLPRNTSVYLTRLHGFGLVEFGPAANDLEDEFDKLETDESVREARRQAERGRLGSIRLVRKSVRLSPLGREFWAACAPPSARSR